MARKVSSQLTRYSADAHARQMRIQVKLEPWRPSLDPAQQQMLDGVVAGRSSADGIVNGGVNLVSGVGFCFVVP